LIDMFPIRLCRWSWCWHPFSAAKHSHKNMRWWWKGKGAVRTANLAW